DHNAVSLEFLSLVFFRETAKHNHVVVRRPDNPRIQGQPEARIEDYSQQRPAPGKSGAVGEQWIVGDDGPNPDHDGVVSVTHFVNMGPRHFAGDPASA